MDIGAGARWSRDIARELSDTSFGILCLTPGNLDAPWLLFEAGALAKTIDDAFVCPYLLGFDPADVPPGPLAQFQAKRANKAETLDLLRTMNAELGNRGLPNGALDRAFDLWWPQLDRCLQAAARENAAPSTARSVPDMLSEVLTEVRAMSRRIVDPLPGRADRIQEYRQLMRRDDVQELITSDERIRALGMTIRTSSWDDNVIEFGMSSDRGAVKAKVERSSWFELDEEAFKRDVVTPIIESLVAGYEASPARRGV